MPNVEREFDAALFDSSMNFHSKQSRLSNLMKASPGEESGSSWQTGGARKITRRYDARDGRSSSILKAGLMITQGNSGGVGKDMSSTRNDSTRHKEKMGGLGASHGYNSHVNSRTRVTEEQIIKLVPPKPRQPKIKVKLDFDAHVHEWDEEMPDFKEKFVRRRLRCDQETPEKGKNQS